MHYGDFATRHLPGLITSEENEEMEKLPDEIEVKQVVFSFNVNSAGGPDSFTGAFCQVC